MKMKPGNVMSKAELELQQNIQHEMHVKAYFKLNILSHIENRALILKEWCGKVQVMEILYGHLRPTAVQQ